MNWLHYLAEANLYLIVFYLCYSLFLNKETFYTLNRIYLLLICVVSFMLPLIQIGRLKPTEQLINYAAPVQVTAEGFTTQDLLLLGSYLLGVVFCIAQLAIKLYQLKKLTRLKPVLVTDGYKLIYIKDSNTAFSFFNYLFIGTDAPEATLITRHELVHIRQKHSVDIILLEIIKIINWFNPVIYLLQNSLKTIHEYIADEQTAAAEQDTIVYSTYLISNAYGLSGSSITHSFFNYNLLKKRIIMLHQKRSDSLARLKYLIAVPLCAGLLCESTIGFSKTYSWIDIAPQRGSVAADTVKKNLPPPPPPAPPVKNQKVPPPPPPAPPKPHVKVTDVKLLPPPPPAAPVKKHKAATPKVTDVKLLPPPPLPEPPVKNQKVPPPPPPVPPVKTKKSDVVRYPPPVVMPNKPKKAAEKRYPPPVLTHDKPKKITEKRYPPPIIVLDETHDEPSR